jgi:hypothetical protein
MGPSGVPRHRYVVPQNKDSASITKNPVKLPWPLVTAIEDERPHRGEGRVHHEYPFMRWRVGVMDNATLGS